MGLPVINISFKELAKTAPIRALRGVVAMILKDTTTSKFTVNDDGDIPSSLTDVNEAYLKDALIGNINTPNKILVYVIGTSGTLADALAYFESQEFNLICMPNAETADNTAINTFIKKLNDVVNYKADALLANNIGNYEGIYNYTASGIKIGGVSIPTDEHIARIAGLIEGTPLTQSITFSPLLEIDEVETLTKPQADARVDAGELILVRESGKIRMARGVTSLTTLVDGKSDIFQKIKLRKVTNLIHNDLRKVMVEKYIGKVPNTYDNKTLLITEIIEYLNDLAKEQLIEKTVNAGIDIEAQKTWLKGNTALDVNNMTELEVKEANTKDNVFLEMSIKLVDSMEDIDIKIAL